MAYIPKYKNGIPVDPNTIENTTNAERMAYADWNMNTPTLTRDSNTGLFNGQNYDQIIGPAVTDYTRRLNAWQQNNVGWNTMPESFKPQPLDVGGGNRIDITSYLPYSATRLYNGSGSVYEKDSYDKIFGAASLVGSTAWYEAEVAAGRQRKVPVGNGFSYIPIGSAGDKLNQAVAANPKLTPQQQFDASLTGNNVNAPGIVPQAPTPAPANTGLATPAYKDAQGKVFDAQGKHLTMDQLEKGPDGKPKVNLTTLPLQSGQSTEATPSQFSNNNNGVYKEWNKGTNNWDVKTIAGKAVSIEDFKNQGLNIDHINTKSVVEGQIKSGGDTGGTTGPTEPPKPQTNPYQDFQKFYSDTLNASGAGNFMDLQKTFKAQLDANNKEMALKILDINDNPWLSESLRSKKVGGLEKAYGEISDSLTKSMDLYLGFYNSAKQDAQFQATQAVNMIHDQASLDQQLLLKEMDLAEKQSDNARADLKDERDYQLDLEGLSLDKKKLALDQYKASLDTAPDSTFSEVITASIDAGATPEQAAQEAAMKSELLGVPVSQKLLSQWKSQAVQYKGQIDKGTQATTDQTTNSYYSPTRQAAGKVDVPLDTSNINIDSWKKAQSTLQGFGASSIYSNLFGQ